jgi:hypothetical protein
MVLLADKAHVEAYFHLFEDSANLDAILVHSLRRMYHVSKIILDAPDGAPR